MEAFKNLKRKMNSPQNPNMWFLVQRILPEGTAAEYFNITSSDIIKYTPSTHAGESVWFILKKVPMKGKVVYSSESKEDVEHFYREMCRIFKNENQNQQKPKSKYLIVQYSHGPNTLIQSLISENDVSMDKPIEPNQKEVIIFQNGQKLLGTVLCMHEEKNIIELELKKLQQFAYEKAANHNEQNSPIGDEDWILIIYTSGSGTAVYAIINNKMTYCPKENRYRDVSAYLTDIKNVYHAIIIRNSSKIEELTHQLNIIKNTSRTLTFPLDIDPYRKLAIPPPEFNSFCGPLEKFQLIFHNKKIHEMFSDLLSYEETMQEDAAFIYEFITKIKNAHHYNLQRFRVINDSVPDLVKKLAPDLETKFADLFCHEGRCAL